jgi:cell wall-associated NlpC family hydrolase
MYRLGQKVASQQAQKGDLLFYGPEGTQTVTMYLGNSQMLEVGDVVQASAVRATDLMPYAVRVLGAQANQVPLQQVPTQQVPGQQTVVPQQAPVRQVPLQPVPAQQAPVQQAPLQQQFLQLPTQPAPVPALQAPGQVPTH